MDSGEPQWGELQEGGGQPVAHWVAVSGRPLMGGLYKVLVWSGERPVYGLSRHSPVKRPQRGAVWPHTILPTLIVTVRAKLSPDQTLSITTNPR